MNEFMNSDAELYTFILAKTGLQLALNCVGVAVGGDSVKGAMGKTLANTICGALEGGCVALNRAVNHSGDAGTSGILDVFLFLGVLGGDAYFNASLRSPLRLPVLNNNNVLVWVVNPLVDAANIPKYAYIPNIVNGMNSALSVTSPFGVLAGIIATQVRDNKRANDS